MKVALDLRAGGWLGGRYYLHNLALALAQLPESERPEVFGIAPAGEAEELAELLTPVSALPDDADVVFPNWNVPPRTAATQLHWIPDLQHRRLRGTFSRTERLKREVAFVRFAVPARRIVVSSEAVRRDAARAYPPFARKLRVLRFTTVIPPGLTQNDPAETLARYDLEPGYLFLPNQFWKHKNHAVAFEAAAGLVRTLVCTGATDDHRDPDYFGRVTAGLPSTVRILGVVPARGLPPAPARRGGARAAVALRGLELRRRGRDEPSASRSRSRTSPCTASRALQASHFFDPGDPTALANAVLARAATAPVPEADSARGSSRSV